MNILKSIALLACMIFSMPLWAHSDDYLDTVAAPNGGQLRMAGALHLELVVTANQLQIHVTDHAGKTVSTQGASGTAITLAKTGKQTLTLAPAQDNLLEAAGTFDPAQPLKAVVTVNLPGQAPVTVRFDTARQQEAEHGQYEQHGDMMHTH